MPSKLGCSSWNEYFNSVEDQPIRVTVSNCTWWLVVFFIQAWFGLTWNWLILIQYRREREGDCVSRGYFELKIA